MKVYRLLMLLFLILLACSCGQTGPLYLPGTPPPIHTEKEQQPPPVDEKKVESTKSASPQN